MFAVYGMWQADSSCVGSTNFGGFEEVDRLTKNLAEITAVDLVDDEKEGTSSGLAYRSRKRSFANCEPEGSFVGVGRQTYDEVLVGYGRVELNRHPATVEELSSDRVGHTRFASSGRPLQYDEPASPDEFVYFTRCGLQEQLGAQACVKGFVLVQSILPYLPPALIR